MGVIQSRRRICKLFVKYWLTFPAGFPFVHDHTRMKIPA